MVELIVSFVIGACLGALIGYRGEWQRNRVEREKAEKRKASALRGASKRKAKALEEATKPVDPQMYGRKANGEGTWAG